VRKPNGNEKLGRPRLRWKDNIKMALQKNSDYIAGWRMEKSSFCGEKKHFVSSRTLHTDCGAQSASYS